MKALRILIIILLLPTSVIFAGNEGNNKKGESMNATISFMGKVIDKQTGEALTGVKIEITGTSEITYTDFDGNFEVKGLKPGNYNLSSSFISYQSQSEKVNLENSFSEKLEIQMESVN